MGGGQGILSGFSIAEPCAEVKTWQRHPRKPGNTKPPQPLQVSSRKVGAKVGRICYPTLWRLAKPPYACGTRPAMKSPVYGAAPCKRG